MISTSYFAVYRGNCGVSIALWPPRFFKGPSYKQLAPTRYILDKYKIDGNEAEYRQAYVSDVLKKLDAREVYDQLDGKTILCYENLNINSFCHRRIVAEWLTYELSVDVPELSPADLNRLCMKQ